MSRLWYRDGTVDLTAGSDQVAGTGTLWLSQVPVGSVFTTDNDTLYMVAAVTDNTHLTIWPAWGGATVAGASYAVIRAFAGTTNADLAARIADLIGRWQTRENQFADWLGGAHNGGPGGDGKYPLTDALGNTRLVESPSRLLRLLDDGVADNAAAIIDAIEDDVVVAQGAADRAQAAVTTVTTASAAAAIAAAQAQDILTLVTAAAESITTATVEAQDILGSFSATAAVIAAQASAVDAAAAIATTAAADILVSADRVQGAAGTATTAAAGATIAASSAAADRAAVMAARDGMAADVIAVGTAMTAAQAARDAAQSWAMSPEDYPVTVAPDGTPSFSARHHAAKAADRAAAASLSASALDAAVATAAVHAAAAGGYAVQAADRAAAAEDSRIGAAEAAAIAAGHTQAAANSALVAGDKAYLAAAAAVTAEAQAAAAVSAAGDAASALTNAQNAAVAAAVSATDALAAKTDAVNARDLAQSYRDLCQGYTVTAQSWAVTGHGVEVVGAPGFYSAYHWAEEAREFAEQAAAIVGGNNFGIIGDGSAQRLVAASPSSMLNIVGGAGAQIVYHQPSLSVTINVVSAAIPVAAAGGITATNVRDALYQLDAVKADRAASLAGYGITDTYTAGQTDAAIAAAVGALSTHTISRGGGAVSVTADGAVAIDPAAGTLVTVAGSEVLTADSGYTRDDADAAIAAAVGALSPHAISRGGGAVSVAADGSVAITPAAGTLVTVAGSEVLTADRGYTRDAAHGVMDARADARIGAWVGAAPAAFDTLVEVAAKLADQDTVAAALTAQIAAKANASAVYTKAEVDALVSRSAVYTHAKAILSGGDGVTVTANDVAKTLSLAWAYAHDPYWSTVRLLLQPPAGPSVYSADATGKAITYGGNAALTTAAAVTGGAGFTFDGSGDYLSLPAGSAFDFGAGDFTIEYLFRLAAVGSHRTLFASQTDFKIGVFVMANGRIGYFASSTGASWDLVCADSGPLNGAGSTVLNANTIYSGAFVRSGGIFKGYVNGVADLTVGGMPGAIVSRSEPFNIGRWGTGGYWMSGEIFAVRITGVARAITVPAALWPVG